jgi:hypothetical protein
MVTGLDEAARTDVREGRIMDRTEIVYSHQSDPSVTIRANYCRVSPGIQGHCDG